jgi:hypothetical protein
VQVQGWSRTVRVSRGSSHPGRAQACILFWYIGLESLDTVQDNCPYLASQGTAVSEQSSRVGPSQLIDTSQASSRAGHSQLVISSQSSAHTQLSGAGEHVSIVYLSNANSFVTLMSQYTHQVCMMELVHGPGRKQVQRHPRRAQLLGPCSPGLPGLQ